MGNFVTGKKVLQRTLRRVTGHGDEEINKGNGDGEGETEDMQKYLS
jgi:hypothetical protein